MSVCVSVCVCVCVCSSMPPLISLQEVELDFNLFIPVSFTFFLTDFIYIYFF